jgi:cysteinyl-tRNA synthetase
MAEEAADDHEGEDRSMFRSALNLLGLLQATDSDWRAWRPKNFALDEDRVRELVEARNAARAARNFADADRLRKDLDVMGVVLKDGPDGTTWEIRR